MGEESRLDWHWAALQNLSRKEIVEEGQNGYRLSVEMFRFWILKNQIAAQSPVL
ncbi:MAG TPA: hypothetical protein VJ810_40785 [Blastocatellia bacterium]|nr:hypothetical protein [Blastocatellia bacterium]